MRWSNTLRHWRRPPYQRGRVLRAPVRQRQSREHDADQQSVKYTSLKYTGWRFGSLYGFSNAAGGFSDNRAYSFGTSYNNGPVRFAASYLQLNSGGSPSNLTGATDSYDFEQQLTGSDSTFSAGQQRTFGAGLNYTYGPALVGFVFTETKLENPTSINNIASPTPLGLSRYKPAFRQLRNQRAATV